MQPAFVKDMADWIGSGKLKYRETIDVGVENAPAAFVKLFSGENIGKMLVKLS
jgi:NADPH-dependent curcumin reductase CurA